MSAYSKEQIRIGTLVNGGSGAANYIRQILPHGFESFGITFWQNIGENDLAKMADEVRKILDGSGAVISHLGIFGNPLAADEDADKTRRSWEALIDNAHLFGCDIVAGFTGRVIDKPIHENIGRFKEVFGPLADRAGAKGLRLAFENCSMGGDWYRGNWNIAHNPVAWELMFEALPQQNIGLQWEPCHQMVQLIDPLPQLKEWAGKMFNIHGKDATIHWDVIRKYGTACAPGRPEGLTSGAKFSPTAPVQHRTPGFGDSNWADIITELRRAGFCGSIDIEGWHDPVYRGDLEMTGQVAGLNYLKRCRGGSFIPNPV